VRRWWLAIALLLSVGVNVGILATLVAGRLGGGRDAPAAGPAEAPPGPPGWRGAGPGPGPEPGGGPPPAVGERIAQRVERLADHLELEGDARQRFVELQRGMLDAGFDARRRRVQLDAELRAELFAPEPDPERIERLIAERGRLEAETDRATAAALLESRRLLTPEQERLYLRVIERLRGAGGPRAGRFRGGPGGGSGAAPAATRHRPSTNSAGTASQARGARARSSCTCRGHSASAASRPTNRASTPAVYGAAGRGTSASGDRRRGTITMGSAPAGTRAA
jgi:Spy/CpxP family protein refolding chaperone